MQRRDAVAQGHNYVQSKTNNWVWLAVRHGTSLATVGALKTR